ncbi:MAG TPA: PEGA domain-containing protein, partial [Polyangiaceae bacterium]|nr:PEGA domain-containing protein [Polyangiaceae bacterium]
SGSLRGTQVSSVTDLMEELTRQRRVTTRLLGGVLALVACSLAFGVYWTLVLRPEQAQTLAAAPLAAARTAAVLPPAAPPAAAAPHAAVAAATAPALAAPIVATKAKASSPGNARAAAATAVVAAPLTRSAPPVVETVSPSPAPVAEMGRLNLDTTPWSIVSVGGRVLGQTPIVGASLPAGTHTLVLSNPEQGLKTTYQITIAAGRTTARRLGLD